jgi:hypothetical protein
MSLSQDLVVFTFCSDQKEMKRSKAKWFVVSLMKKEKLDTGCPEVMNTLN